MAIRKQVAEELFSGTIVPITKEKIHQPKTFQVEKSVESDIDKKTNEIDQTLAELESLKLLEDDTQLVVGRERSIRDRLSSVLHVNEINELLGPEGSDDIIADATISDKLKLLEEEEQELLKSLMEDNPHVPSGQLGDAQSNQQGRGHPKSQSSKQNTLLEKSTSAPRLTPTKPISTPSGKSGTSRREIFGPVRRKFTEVVRPDFLNKKTTANPNVSHKKQNSFDDKLSPVPFSAGVPMQRVNPSQQLSAQAQSQTAAQSKDHTDDVITPSLPAVPPPMILPPTPEEIDDLEDFTDSMVGSWIEPPEVSPVIKGTPLPVVSAKDLKVPLTTRQHSNPEQPRRPAPESSHRKPPKPRFKKTEQSQSAGNLDTNIVHRGPPSQHQKLNQSQPIKPQSNPQAHPNPQPTQPPSQVPPPSQGEAGSSPPASGTPQPPFVQSQGTQLTPQPAPQPAPQVAHQPVSQASPQASVPATGSQPQAASSPSGQIQPGVNQNGAPLPNRGQPRGRVIPRGGPRGGSQRGRLVSTSDKGLEGARGGLESPRGGEIPRGASTRGTRGGPNRGGPPNPAKLQNSAPPQNRESPPQSATPNEQLTSVQTQVQSPAQPGKVQGHPNQQGKPTPTQPVGQPTQPAQVVGQQEQPRQPGQSGQSVKKPLKIKLPSEKQNSYEKVVVDDFEKQEEERRIKKEEEERRIKEEEEEEARRQEREEEESRRVEEERSKREEEEQQKRRAAEEERRKREMERRRQEEIRKRQEQEEANKKLLEIRRKKEEEMRRQNEIAEQKKKEQQEKLKTILENERVKELLEQKRLELLEQKKALENEKRDSIQIQRNNIEENEAEYEDEYTATAKEDELDSDINQSGGAGGENNQTGRPSAKDRRRRRKSSEDNSIDSLLGSCAPLRSKQSAPPASYALSEEINDDVEDKLEKEEEEEEVESSVLYTDGSRYIGPIKDGKWEGRGRVFFSNGNYYEGELRGGSLNGLGTMRYANGDEYYGQWGKDTREGWGRYISSRGDIYEGIFSQDRRHGKGVYTLSNGDRYEGEFKNGSPNGFGGKTHFSFFNNNCNFINELLPILQPIILLMEMFTLVN